MIRYPVLLLAGVLAAPLLDLGSVFWMNAMPPRLDLTAHYFVMVVLPVALVLHFVLALLLWKAFEPSPGKGSAAYLGSHAIAQGAMLSQFGNPPADIALCVMTSFACGAAVLFVFNRYFWCPACAAISR